MIVPWTLAADFAQLAAEAGLQRRVSAVIGRDVSSQERAARSPGRARPQNTSGSHLGRDR